MSTMETSPEVSAASVQDNPEEPEQRWYWCSACLLVSERRGACPGCRAEMIPAPDRGIPAGPYRPRLDTARRSRTAVVLSAVAAVLVMGAIAAGILLLVNHGQPLDSAEAGRPGSGVTTYAVSSLGATIALPGSWTSDDSLGSTAVADAADLTGGGTGVVEVSARRGSDVFTVVSVPTSNPKSVLDANRNSQPQSNAAADGTRVDVSAAIDMTIKQHPAVVNDLEERSSSGQLVSKSRLYVVQADGHVVIIVAVVPGNRAASDLPGIIQAVSTLS